jgi:hypothetical protein
MTPTKYLLHTLVDSFELMYIPIDISHTRRYIYMYVRHRWATCGCPWGLRMCVAVYTYTYIYICACMAPGGPRATHIDTCPPSDRQPPQCSRAAPSACLLAQGRRPTGDLCARARGRCLDSTRPRRTPPPGAAPPTAPTRPANWPPPSPTARSPARLPLPPSPPPPFPSHVLPSSPSRAPAHPPCLPACLPACLPLWPRAPPTALLLHIPTDLDRATIVRANVPGSESRSGGGPLARADRAPPTRPCAPANWRPPFVTRRRRARPGGVDDRPRAHDHLGPPTGVHPWRWRSEGTGRRRSPRVPGERCLAPLQAPGAAGPVDGRCLPTNLAKDRADAQRLVATRLLDRLHDPLGHFSRLQRIHPRAR